MCIGKMGKIEETCSVLGFPYAVSTVEGSAQRIIAMAKEKGSTKSVVFAPVYDAVLAKQNAAVREAMLSADMICPDGMPIAWMQRLKGHKAAGRCCGPDVMDEVFRRSVEAGQRHFFYGSTQDVLSAMIANVEGRYQGVKVCGHYSPPFRVLSAEEDAMVIAMLDQSGADYLWVGLGCPKQQLWMHEHKQRITVPVMLGVGAAFDFFAGTKSRAPVWMQKRGLEWLFRLCSEPKRLWKRYTVYNALFAWYALGDLFCFGQQGRLEKKRK